jgi:FkbM family methyltransferase
LIKSFVKKVLPYKQVKSLRNGKIQFLQAATCYFTLLKSGSSFREKEIAPNIKLLLDISKKTQFLEYYFDYEGYIKKLAAEILKPGDIAIDVGGHVGYWSLLFSHFVGPTGSVHSFEPQPENNYRLRMHVHLNNIKHCTVNTLGVSNREGETSLSINLTNDGGHHIPTTQEDTGFGSIKLTTLDKYIIENNLKGIRLIKIDVEGHEPQALEGMHQVLSRPEFRPEYLILEISVNESERRKELVEKMAGYGFDALEMAPTGRRPFDLTRPIHQEILFHARP